MKIMVSVNGVSVPVEIDDQMFKEAYAKIRKDTVSAVIREYLESHDLSLSDAEIQGIIDNSPYAEDQNTFDQFLSDIVSGALWDKLTDAADDVMQNRTLYYKVIVRATQDFDLYVKAKSAKEAEEYINDSGYQVLSEFPKVYDTKYRAVEVDDEGLEECPKGCDSVEAEEVY